MQPSIVGLALTPHELEALMEGMVLANVAQLRKGQAPRLLPPPGMGAAPHIRYQRERRDRRGNRLEHWRLAREVARLGAGDCEDLAAYWAAELRATGRDPRARVRVVRTGPALLHAIVQRGNGRVDDPSRWLGMRGPG